MKQQARNLAIHFGDEAEKPRYLIRDLDSKFTKNFDGILEQEGIEVVRVGPKQPNMNAFAERFVQSIKSECLDHFLIFGDKHLRFLIGQYLQHYHLERPHQGLDDKLLRGMPETPTSASGEVECYERLGGLLKSYRRKAALIATRLFDSSSPDKALGDR